MTAASVAPATLDRGHFLDLTPVADVIGMATVLYVVAFVCGSGPLFLFKGAE